MVFLACPCLAFFLDHDPVVSPCYDPFHDRGIDPFHVLHLDPFLDRSSDLSSDPSVFLIAGRLRRPISSSVGSAPIPFYGIIEVSILSL